MSLKRVKFEADEVISQMMRNTQDFMQTKEGSFLQENIARNNFELKDVHLKPNQILFTQKVVKTIEEKLDSLVI
jgi:hypothetical protein